jgi:hypothetical protein
MSLFNQYSYVIGSLIILVVVLLAMRRFHVRRVALGSAVIVIVFVLLAGFLILRPGNSDVNSTQAAEAMLKNGKPTFLEFFSNY